MAATRTLVRERLKLVQPGGHPGCGRILRVLLSAYDRPQQCVARTLSRYMPGLSPTSEHRRASGCSGRGATRDHGGAASRTGAVRETAPRICTRL
eukprot:scaffold1883_cov396-Prasinococcus_capsulatus_cf.AAC.6